MAVKLIEVRSDDGIARLQNAIRDMEFLRVQSLGRLAESNDLLKLVEKIDSPVLSGRPRKQADDQNGREIAR